MKDLIEAIKTNENNARTRALIALGITATAIAAGVYFSKKGNATPVVVVIEDAADVLTDVPSV